MDCDEVLIEEEPKAEVLFPPSKSLNDVKNKIRRRELFLKQKRLQIKEKKAKKKKKQSEEADVPKQVPKTIESLREADVTTISSLDDEANKEVVQDIVTSEYATYFNKVYEPKVLVTFGGDPTKKALTFARNLQLIIPNALCRFRKKFTVKEIVASCNREGYTDIVIINENMKKMNSLMLIHLPEGPTINFRLSSVFTMANLKRNFQHVKEVRPEVILTNFSTRLGNRVASILAALFHYDPEFKGRRAVTFHNQRDYIFFRHHRYEFKDNGRRAALREIGPRFTLKPLWLQSGVFDGKTAEYEWMIAGRRHQMETSRRKFFL